MKSNRLRIIIPLAVLAVIAVGFVLNFGTGSLSAFGWTDVSLICPLGALTTMLAEHTLVPRALISMAVVLVIILITGRLFCGWVCPVPLIKRIPNLFKSKHKLAEEQQADPTAIRIGAAHPCTKAQHKACGACNGCADVHAKVDSRHFVLGGAVLSAAIFGFPVFCLVCPIGLTFAFVFMVIALFGTGDITWGLVAIPVVLALELLVFRKWCSHICPLSALMSLLAKVKSPVLRVNVDASKCLETEGGSCGRCAAVCPERIDPRHPELGAGWNECAKCRACVDSCPAGAISMPLFAGKGASGGSEGGTRNAIADQANHGQTGNSDAETCDGTNAAGASDSAAPQN